MCSEQTPLNTERYLLFAPDIHVGIGATIHIRVTEQQIQSALSAVYSRHPLLSAVIRIDEQNRAFYCLNEAPVVQPDFLELNSIDATSIHIVEEWIQHCNRKPFDLQRGSLFHLLVARDRDTTMLAILGHHIIGDGLSYFYLLRDLLCALDGQPQSKSLPLYTIRDSEDIPRNARLRLRGKLLARLSNRAYRKTGRRYTFADYLALYDRHLQRKPVRRIFFLNEAETARIIKNCKAHGVRVNDGITAAFHAVRSKIGGHAKYIGVSCNIRNTLIGAPDGCMGNFVSGVLVTPEYDVSRSIWENAKIIHKEIYNKLNVPWQRAAAITFLDELSDEIHDSMNFYVFEDTPNPVQQRLEPYIVGEKFRGLGISNLGSQTIQVQNFTLSHVWFSPPLFGMGDYIVGVLSTDGQMTFNLTFSETDIEESNAIEIFLQARQLLLDDDIR